jgi:hypothetical protein
MDGSHGIFIIFFTDSNIFIPTDIIAVKVKSRTKFKKILVVSIAFVVAWFYLHSIKFSFPDISP